MYYRERRLRTGHACAPGTSSPLLRTLQCGNRGGMHMFCNHCGAPLQPDYLVCPRCGKALHAGAPVAPSRLEQHLRTLGILWMIVGGLTLVPALILMFLSSVAHMAIPFSNAVAHELGPLFLMIVGAGFLIVGAGGLLVGWGLIKH